MLKRGKNDIKHGGGKVITHINKNVVCIKDIPSNLIEEAIFILKTGTEGIDKKWKKSKNEIIVQESNDLIDDFMISFKKKKEEIKNRETAWRRKILMAIAIAGIIGVAVLLMLS